MNQNASTFWVFAAVGILVAMMLYTIDVLQSTRAELFEGQARQEVALTTLFEGQARQDLAQADNKLQLAKLFEGQARQEVALVEQIKGLPQAILETAAQMERCKDSVTMQAVAFSGTLPNGKPVKHMCSAGRVGPPHYGSFITASHCLYKSNKQPFEMVSDAFSLMDGHASNATAVHVHPVLFSRNEDFAFVFSSLPGDSQRRYKVADLLASLMHLEKSLRHRKGLDDAFGVAVHLTKNDKTPPVEILRVRSVTLRHGMPRKENLCATANSAAAGGVHPVLALTEAVQAYAAVNVEYLLSNKDGTTCAFEGDLQPMLTETFTGNSGGVFYQAAIVDSKCVLVPHAVTSANAHDTNMGYASLLPQGMPHVVTEALRQLEALFGPRLDADPQLLVLARELPVWEVVLDSETMEHKLVDAKTVLGRLLDLRY